MNNENKMRNNNIYSKITKKQANEIYPKLKNLSLMHFIRGKYPVDIKMLIDDNYAENILILSSKDMNIINKVEIENLNDNSFSEIFDKVVEWKNAYFNINFKNCELKEIKLEKIPFSFQQLIINDSKIYHSIFNNISLKNLVKLNLDDNQIDDFNFDGIFNCILESDAKNLKEFSAKNNYISRVILNKQSYKQKNVLTSLEIFNLSNNKIYNVDERVLKLIPNVVIFDLTNNLLALVNCKQLFKNCKGIILISNSHANNYLGDYFKNEKIKTKPNTLDILKFNLKRKLEEVKSGLKKLNLKLENNINEQNEKIENKFNKYIYNFKDKSIAYVQENEKKINEKEIRSKVYFNAIRNAKRFERFQKNMNDIILDSVKNYNNFISYELPYYKNSSHLFLMNNENKMRNNNIYSKITKKQVNKIYNKLKSLNLIHFIRGKFPVDIKILIDDNCIEDTLILSSKDMNIINNVEIENLNNYSFDDVFNNVIEWKNTKFNIRFKNCELKEIKIEKIPFSFQQLIINDSKINHSILNNLPCINLVKLNLDNNQIDSYYFDNLFNCLLEADAKNLKEFSAKNNYISKVNLNHKLFSQKNILNSLEIFNLSNNSIYAVDTRILNLIPNLKIFDLSNNCLLHHINCKELIKNCKGIVVLLKNLVILKPPMYSYYLDYFEKFITNKIDKKFPLYSINFDSLFYESNNENIADLIQTIIKNNENISEINLSSCSLKNQGVIDILSKSYTLKNNLIKLNLSYNGLTEDIFDLLINDNIKVILKDLKELDLSFNLINFKYIDKKKNIDPKTNQFAIFLSNYFQLELLNLKTTPFEEVINEYIKLEIKLHYAKEHKNEKHTVKIPNEYQHEQLKDVIMNHFLEINPSFHIIINDLITTKYSSAKRMKQILPILDQNLIIDNLKPETKQN